MTFLSGAAEDGRIGVVSGLRVLDQVEAGRRSLKEQLMALADGANVRADGALTVPSEYLEVVVTRR
jgi:hypothetical protein